jgi:deoxycytidine triphosphate deaminase
MTLLRDEDLVARVQAIPPLVAGLRQPGDWYSSESLIQSASIDLTIGDIFIPGADADDPGGINLPRTELSLETGRTAIVTTREELRLPSNIAGIGFPPSRVSFRGLLMTNPGHVDPGYAGPLRFTVINMAREPFPLKTGDAIVTVLFLELGRDVRADFVARRPDYAPRKPTREQIDWLSKDFVDVEERSTRIAKKEAKDAGIRISAWAATVPVLISFLALGQSCLTPPSWKEALDTRMGVLEKSVQFEKETTTIRAHQTQLENLAKELGEVRAATCNQRPAPAYCPRVGRQ